MLRIANNERGVAIMSVLAVVVLFAIIAVIGLSLAGKDTGISTVRAHGARSMGIAEGGAFAARSTLMALIGADPLGAATVSSTLDGSNLASMYTNQNAFSVLDYVSLDGAQYSTGASGATDWLLFHVNWSAAQPRRKLTFVQAGTGATPTDPLAVGTPVANALGRGSYRAAIVLERRREAGGADCPVGSPIEGCYVQMLGGGQEYEFFYRYTIVAEGQVSPQYRRRVTLRGDFSALISNQNFAKYVLFTHVHTSPSGSTTWFSNRVSFDGPVHTNGQFAFATFPKFGTPDSTTPCDTARIGSTTMTSTGTQAWFNNSGSAVQLDANENVVGGVRVDGPVLPDCTSETSDDNDNPAANFTRNFDGDPATAGVQPITVPLSSWNQKAVSLGLSVGTEDPTTVTNMQVRQAIPELHDNATAVPNGIYVPVVDGNGNDVSDADEVMGGGIYVQGNLSSMSMSQTTPALSPTACTHGSGCAVYTLVQGTQTVTITVDRLASRTTVTDTNWPYGNQTRAFSGVPKGLQAAGRDNAAMIFVQGDIEALSGTLEQNEQSMISATGRINITNHVRYESVPDITNPSSNPTNILGIYSRNNDVRIMTHQNDTAGTNDLDVHAIVMAGTPGASDGYNSAFFVEGASSGANRGNVNLIGGAITEYYGQFGTFNTSTGEGITGYRRNFRFDRRMQRGFAPPYFPTRTGYGIGQGRDPIAGVRPTWREAAP